MAVQHLGVPQPGDYVSLPSRRETSSHFPQGALTAKWIEMFSALFQYDLKVNAEAEKWGNLDKQMHKTLNIFLSLSLCVSRCSIFMPERTANLHPTLPISIGPGTVRLQPYQLLC